MSRNHILLITAATAAIGVLAVPTVQTISWTQADVEHLSTGLLIEEINQLGKLMESQSPLVAWAIGLRVLHLGQELERRPDSPLRKSGDPVGLERLLRELRLQ